MREQDILHSSRCTRLKNEFSVHTLGEFLANTSILPCLAGGIGWKSFELLTKKQKYQYQYLDSKVLSTITDFSAIASCPFLSVKSARRVKGGRAEVASASARVTKMACICILIIDKWKGLNESNLLGQVKDTNQRRKEAKKRKKKCSNDHRSVRKRRDGQRRTPEREPFYSPELKFAVTEQCH